MFAVAVDGGRFRRWSLETGVVFGVVFVGLTDCGWRFESELPVFQQRIPEDDGEHQVRGSVRPVQFGLQN